MLVLDLKQIRHEHVVLVLVPRSQHLRRVVIFGVDLGDLASRVYKGVRMKIDGGEGSLTSCSPGLIPQSIAILLSRIISFRRNILIGQGLLFLLQVVIVLDELLLCFWSYSLGDLLVFSVGHYGNFYS